MMDRHTIAQLYPGRTGPLLPKASPNKPAGTSDSSSFQALLDRQLVKFSHHAEQRLSQRGIQLGPDTLNRLGGAIDKAAAKGAKESLVLFQDMAFIVNVKSRTIVTAMDGASVQDHVFTQIDSAVVVR